MPAGRPTAYNPDFHPENLIKLSKEGLTIIECCDEWNIDDTTFYRWIKKHEEFRRVYRRARVHQQAFMIRQGRTGMMMGKDFNDKVYSILARTAYKMTPDDRAVIIENFETLKSIEEKMDFIIKAMVTGEITIKEAESLISVVKDALNLSEIAKLAEDVKQLQAANGISG